MKPVEPSSKRRWSRHRKEMCNVSKRLETFKKISWSLSSPNPEKLSAVGFYYNPIQRPQQRLDNVTCFMCSKSFYDWEENDDPLKEHITHSPSCPWAYVLSARNNPHQDPRAPSLTKCRELTFVDKVWPYINRSDFHCQPNTMAAAGFVFTPSTDSKDAAHCLYCNIDLHDWEPDDDPFKEHQRRRPDCLFFTWTDPTALSPTKLSLFSSSNVDLEDVSVSELVSNSSEKNPSKMANESKTSPRRRISSLSQSHPFSLYSNSNHDSSLVQSENHGSSPSKPAVVTSPRRRGKQLRRKSKDAVFKPARPIFSDEDEDEQPDFRSSPPKFSTNTPKKHNQQQEDSSHILPNGSNFPFNSTLPLSTPPSPNRTDESYHSIHSPVATALPPIQEDAGESNSKENSVNYSNYAEPTNTPTMSLSNITFPAETIVNSKYPEESFQTSKKRKSSEIEDVSHQQQMDTVPELTLPTVKRQLSTESTTANDTKNQLASSESEVEAFSAETSIFEDFPQNPSINKHASSFITSDDEPLAKLLQSPKHKVLTEGKDVSPEISKNRSEKHSVSSLKDNSSSSLEAVHTPTSDFDRDSALESDTLTASSITPTKDEILKNNNNKTMNSDPLINSTPKQDSRQRCSSETKHSEIKGDYQDSKPLRNLTNIERTALKRPSTISEDPLLSESRGLLDTQTETLSSSKEDEEQTLRKDTRMDVNTNSPTNEEIFHDSENAFSKSLGPSEKELEGSSSEVRSEEHKPTNANSELSNNLFKTEENESVGSKEAVGSLGNSKTPLQNSPGESDIYEVQHSLHSTPKGHHHLDELPEFSASPSKHFPDDISKSPFDPLSQSSFLAPRTPMRTKPAPPSIKPSLPPWEPVDFSSLLETPANKRRESEDLTEEELNMTVENWIKYQYARCAKAFEEECERQIEWLLKEGKRAEDYIQNL
ncbi:survivin [Schizosaccharomyces cryophilus OY26]|uniref:Survivin n=1 Tax=Schizosaccharomyces cryophilus (strain OY26 / ATCC MYA-4695 / CBS 11777 / NBRC 106824 / NRRL Y48691) TaxID=653667 RepID=S9VPR2_SCHCR|nr:survivin [Schizosaccharomyces cryophilus OY26]EPY49928.1 survivin [Schizosaccharomyces cryophilus OY26]